MATAKIDVVGPQEYPIVADLYSQIFRPPRNAEFFRRRYLGRYNQLVLLATLEEKPVGFFCGFELKPSVYFSWLYGVQPECRRMGIASQLMDAVEGWVRQHGYASIRLECHNQHRPMLHMCIDRAYDVVGMRWDPDRGENLVLFEKGLGGEDAE